MIAGEIESSTVDKGLWLEALVASGGESGPKQEAAYAALKVAALRAVFDATETESKKAIVQARSDAAATKYGVELIALQKSFTYNQPLTEVGFGQARSVGSGNVERRPAVPVLRRDTLASGL